MIHFPHARHKARLVASFITYTYRDTSVLEKDAIAATITTKTSENDRLRFIPANHNTTFSHRLLYSYISQFTYTFSCRTPESNHFKGLHRNFHSLQRTEKTAHTNTVLKDHQRNLNKTSVLHTENENDKSFTNSVLNVVKENGATNTVNRRHSSHQRGSKTSKSKKLYKNKNSERIKRILPHFFSEDGKPLPTLTVEKQLLGLMQMWAMEEAVELLKESVEEGINPDRTVILNLLQQLANLGEVCRVLNVYRNTCVYIWFR